MEIIPISSAKIPSILKEVDIILNATPCGMKGFKFKYPFPKKYIQQIKKECVLAEAVYTPYLTPLLEQAKKQGNKVSPGINMLVEQAAESFLLAFEQELTKGDKEMMKKVAMKELGIK